MAVNVLYSAQLAVSLTLVSLLYFAHSSTFSCNPPSCKEPEPANLAQNCNHSIFCKSDPSDTCHNVFMHLCNDSNGTDCGENVHAIGDDWMCHPRPIDESECSVNCSHTFTNSTWVKCSAIIGSNYTSEDSTIVGIHVQNDLNSVTDISFNGSFFVWNSPIPAPLDGIDIAYNVTLQYTNETLINDTVTTVHTDTAFEIPSHVDQCQLLTITIFAFVTSCGILSSTSETLDSVATLPPPQIPSDDVSVDCVKSTVNFSIDPDCPGKWPGTVELEVIWDTSSENNTTFKKFEDVFFNGSVVISSNISFPTNKPFNITIKLVNEVGKNDSKKESVCRSHTESTSTYTMLSSCTADNQGICPSSVMPSATSNTTNGTNNNDSAARVTILLLSVLLMISVGIIGHGLHSV